MKRILLLVLCVMLVGCIEIGTRDYVGNAQKALDMIDCESLFDNNYSHEKRLSYGYYRLGVMQGIRVTFWGNESIQDGFERVYHDS